LAIRSSGIFMGILIAGLGALLLLDQLGVVSFGRAITMWWPVVLIAAGLNLVIEARAASLGAFIFIALGAVMLLVNLGVIPLASIGRLWPLALILLGASMVFRTRSKPRG
jgi:hypothetical protein